MRSEETALLRGALVLLCSHIEGYFEELIGDVIFALDTRVQTAARLPDAIRARQVLGDSSKWNNSGYTERWKLVREYAASPLFDDAAAHVPGQLDAGLHTDGFANPGTRGDQRSI
jgi:hypothetical protein